MQASLTPERWAQVQQLFDEVVDLEPAARAVRLDKACVDDPGLREEVESLLAAYAQADELLQSLDQLGGVSPSPASPRGSRAGTHVAHYEVIEKLGGGGMGVVYKARDTRLKRTVALKFLPLEWSHHTEARQRFENEAQAASALDHPNICTIHDIDETDDGHLFIAMAYYEGETLKRKIKQGPLPLEEALQYAVQMARGLEKAHAQSIVHRDIKPANVMVTEDGVVKVLDFGLAKMAHVHLTKTGTRMGTLAYMSPEQTRGDTVDHRTDVWSLGVVLYEMLAGEHPFQDDYDQAIVYALLHEDPTPITERNPEVPPDLEHMVAMCLEKEPDLRYPAMTDLLADLEAFAQSDGSGSTTALRVARHRKRKRQQRNAIRMGAGLLLLLVLALAIPGSRHAILRAFGDTSVPAEKRIAVLPFINNLGNTPENQALVDGLMQSLTSMIARLQMVEDLLWVVPASEIIRRGITTASDAEKILGVNVVLTGSVQRMGQKTEVILELIDPHPQAPRIIDTESIPGPLNPAFQQQVHRALMSLLRVRFDAQARQAVSTGRSTEPNAYAFYLRGMGYLQRYDKEGNLDNAIVLFNQALEEDSLYALAYAGLCEAAWEKYRKTNDTALADLALQNCDRAGILADDQAAVLIPLGSIYSQTGQYKKAKQTLLRARALEPDNADAYRWLGFVYEKQGEFDQAEDAYEQAIGLKPNFWLYYQELGTLYIYNGRHEEASEQFEWVRRLTPDNYLAYNALGYTRLQLNQVEEAKELFRRSIEKQPNVIASRNLGLVYFREQQYDEAVRELEKARTLDEDDWLAWRWLGHAYYWNDSPAQAQAAWQRMIDLAEPLIDVNAKDIDVLSALAEAYTALDDHVQARFYLDRVLALPRQGNFLPYFIGRVYEMLGDRELALFYIEQALENHFDPVTLDQDPWLEDLRTEPSYQDLRHRFLEPAD